MVLEDTSIQQFPFHRQPVYAISVHPTLPLAASGGEDELGYVWDITTGEQILKLTGHTDSVTNTAFSVDGTLLATGGMDGKARIWRRVAKDESGRTWEFLTELLGPDEIMWLQWHPKGNVLLAGGNDATLWLWQLPSGNTMQVFAGHDSPIHAGSFTPDGKRILTGDESGNLFFWDPRETTPVWKLSASDGRFALEGGITSIGINPSSTLAVVGGATGGIRVVNLAKGSVVGALEGHEEGESIEAIKFLEFGAAGAGMVATGGTDGKICVWDLSNMNLRTTLQHSDAITTLLPHPAPSAHVITSASADRTVKTWDARAGKLLKDNVGHQGPVFRAALGMDGSVVTTGSEDGVCLVFSTSA
ncbi:WD40 repeat-like protein [Clavulina sp. PMI_390]|nr:WD40 repeat-like protein [Clavulina sp. PMI_390]